MYEKVEDKSSTFFLLYLCATGFCLIKMKKFLSILFLLCFCPILTLAEGVLNDLNFEYGGGVDSWIDNTEFGGCEFQDDQTMASTRLMAEVGLSTLEDKNRLRHAFMVGGYASLNWGDGGKFETAVPLAYYRLSRKGQREGNGVEFEMGAFKRSDLRRFPRMFFQDSILFYRPTVEGLMIDLSRGNEKGSAFGFRQTYFTAWLDWTGRQKENRRESFMAAWSGRYAWAGLYVSHYGSMIHFAKRKNHPEDGIRTNLLTYTSLGYDFAAHFSKVKELSIEAGYVQGAEENREIDKWYWNGAFYAQVAAEYWRFRISNAVYAGKGQMRAYGNYGNALYWGDPVYRSSFYDRIDAGINFVETEHVHLFLDMTFHLFKGGDLYPEQQLRCSFVF